MHSGFVKVLGSNKGSTCRPEHCWLLEAHVKAMVTCEKFDYKTVLCYMRSLRCHSVCSKRHLPKRQPAYFATKMHEVHSNKHSGSSAHVKYDGIALADRSSKHAHGRKRTGATHMPKYGMVPAVAVLHAHTAHSTLLTWKCQARLAEYLQAVANGRVSVCCAHVSVYIQSEHQLTHTKHVSNCCTATHPVQVGRPPLHA